MGGLWFGADIARHLHCRRVMAEKKILALEDKSNGQKEKSTFIIKRHDIRPGDKIVLSEDVCHNFSSTNKLVGLVESRGAEVVAIACCLNRSTIIKTDWHGIPVIALEERPIDQYKQDDPRIAEDVAVHGISFDPKGDWDKLMKIMENGI